MQPLSADGRPLRAEFRVEPTDPWPSVVLESRSGSARNPDYHPALTVILARLRQLGATLEDAIVDSTVSRRLPYEERRLHLRQRTYPVTLRDEADVDDLRRAIGAAQAPVAQRKGAKGGNRHKRIRLYVSGLDDYEYDLQTRLAAGGSASDAVRAATDAIGGPRRTQRPREGRRGSGQGRGLTAEQRTVVELHAMNVVTESLVMKGWTVVDVSDQHRGYDLLATRQDEELHVESKGTTGGGASVLVTRGEVAYAREHSQHVQLSIVSGIELSQSDDGRWVASGGSERHIRPWHPDDSVLEPVGYEWLVPPE